MITWSTEPWEHVTDGVYRAVCHPARMNSGLVIGSTGYALIDPGAHPSAARALREAAEQITDVPLRAVIITHAHWDHWFGASAFGDDVDIIAHERLTADACQGENRAKLEELGLGLDDVPTLTRAIALGTYVDLGDRHLEISHLGPAHTDSDVIVSLVDGSALFVGDLIEQGAAPQVDASGSLHEWPGLLDRVSGLLRPGVKIIPGHGDVVDKAFTFNQRNDLLDVCQQAEKLCREGKNVDQALQEGTWPWSEADGMREVLTSAYAELATRGVRPGLTLSLRPGHA